MGADLRTRITIIITNQTFECGRLVSRGRLACHCGTWSKPNVNLADRRRVWHRHLTAWKGAAQILSMWCSNEDIAVCKLAAKTLDSSYCLLYSAVCLDNGPSSSSKGMLFSMLILRECF